MMDGTIVYQTTVEYLGTNSKNKSGKSNKFYEVTIYEHRPTQQGKQFSIVSRWGKYGTTGRREKNASFFGLDWAIATANGFINKKRKKGYTDPVNALTRLATAMED